MDSTTKKLLFALLVVVVSLVACQRQADHSSDVTEGALYDNLFDQYKVLEGYFNNDQHDSLKNAVPSLLEQCKKHQQWRIYYMAWELQAEDYVWVGEHRKAIEEALKMEQEALNQNNNFGQMQAFFVMGLAYNVLANYEEGARCLQRAIELYDPEMCSVNTLVSMYYHYAQNFREMDSCDAKADTMMRNWKAVLDDYPLDKAKQEDEEWGWYSQYYSSLAEYYEKRDRYQEALAAMDSADYCNSHIETSIFEVINYITIRSSVLCGLERYEEAKVYADEAQHLLDSMIQVVGDVSSTYQISLDQSYCRIQAGLGNYREAYQIQERYDSLRFVASDKEIRIQLNELNKRFEIDEIKKQNEQLQQRSRFTTGGVAMILGIVAMLVFLVANNRWRHKLEVKNRQLERERNLVVAQNKQLAIERDRAEAALNAKSAFLQSMTHEIRTPLNAIGGFTQVLTTPGIELPDAERQDYSQRIQENIRLLTTILDDLLLITNLESSTELPEPEDCLPSGLVAMAAESVRSLVAPGVELSVQCAMPEEQIIKTHPQLIQLALSRLLDNAAKFTKEGSISISLSQEGRLLHFSVSDTGPGIPADKRDFIFERFAKLDSFVHGTGLGLSIARMVAERLGGVLTLDSDYTSGAKFDFVIPFDE